MPAKPTRHKRNIAHQILSRLGRILVGFYNRFLKLRGSLRQASLGMALGVFVGMTPFLGFHTVLAVMLASVFRWSKIGAALGVFITNPITAPIIYPLTYRLGATLTGFSEPVQWFRLLEPGAFVDLIKNSPMIIVDMLVGGTLVGKPLSVVAYFVTYAVVSKARKRIQRKRAQRKLKSRSRSLQKPSSSGRRC